jgi:hypothetical protein
MSHGTVTWTKVGPTRITRSPRVQINNKIKVPSHDHNSKSQTCYDLLLKLIIKSKFRVMITLQSHDYTSESQTCYDYC